VFQQVKLTAEEQQRLRARAAELGASVPRLMVEAALGSATGMTPDRQREVAELFEVRRLLATVANNVNQLARAANTTGELAMQRRLEDALADIAELVGRVRGLTGARR
jgi:Bacterial mobilisation protein (MobC)